MYRHICKHYALCAALLASVLMTTAVNAANDDPESYAQGEDMHQQNCVKCHSDSVYTRETRFIKSIDALGKQVRRCKDGNNVSWFDEDTEAVVNFLNTKYYKF